jgi:hypothetical protein
MIIKCSYTDLIEPSKLTPNPKNPNKHTQDQIDRLAKVIAFQGQRSPVVVSKKSGFIVTGHGRLMAMIKLGFEKVAVDYQEFKDDAEEYAHMTADNAIANWSALDLSQISADILDFGTDFDIDLMAIKNFSVIPEMDEEDGEEAEEDEDRKWALQVDLPTEMDMRDLYDDLISKGYIVKELK